MMTSYEQFIASKRLVVPAAGIDVPAERLNPHLFPFQAAITRWALSKGRAACFAGTGLGKTRIQLAWAEHAAERVLILAPLAVAQQTVREGEKIGIPVTYARSEAQAPAIGITVTNYEMLHLFNPAAYGAVVIDESSILKSYNGKTRTALIEAFRRTPMRLACTATPAPNDIAEIANHAEFLGVMSRVEMLASFFVHDEAGWRLKGHAHEPFYRWLSSWAMSVNHPAELGFEQPGYDLPALSVLPEFVDTDYLPPGRLFADRLQGVTERAAVRRDTIADRIERAAEIIAAESGEPWLVWTGLNEESARMAKAISDAVEVRGDQSIDLKTDRLLGFAEGRYRVLVSKAGICGHGLNFQHCARMVFVGLGDSFEQYYQGIRRCWRFGQARETRGWIVLTEPERCIWENVRNKEREAERMSRQLIAHVAGYEREEMGKSKTGTAIYRPETPILLPAWL